MKVIRG